ncbi:glycosyltransferase family 4 protein [Urechidicola vernalis]|uniref:Glycosyltransferase family 4 protein n=1 Tax=Urechidicola vernalis TaxID=3075600 RepID=A0ABU2Y268_9FLAO|nr:glycosyltransferase family 4 protein [Urechidicola sp. P050]MDT0552256.1 glycosyltransferase family 4 protein [Urechidicola sp. P050]
MSKKTIWVLNQTAGKPTSGWGERHYYFAQKWIEKGYDVMIISGSYNHLFHTQPEIGKKPFTLERIDEKLSFCWVKTPPYFDGGVRKFWSNMVFMFRLFFLPFSKLSRPNYIIVSSMPIFPILNGYLLRRKFKAKKLITEIRDLWPLTPMYLLGYSKNHPLIKIVGWFEKFAYKQSDAIVSLLPNAATYINAISKDANKFHWIPNGIDEDLLDHESISNEMISQFPNNKFIIGYAGTMGMANALEYFVAASTLMQHEERIHFVLVGDGYLKEGLLVQTNNQKNISFLPKVKKNQVQALLSNFDVCFIGRNNTPLFDHGVSSNKYFDYMLACKPVLVSSNLIKDPVELSGCGITVAPESAQAIVDGIQRLSNLSTEELNKFGRLGKQYVKKYHNFEYLSNQYLKLF